MTMREYVEGATVKVLWGEEIKPVTNQAADIFDRLIPEWAVSFLAKNRKYKAVTNDLGPRGVFPDINRKVGILKDRVWDGNGVVGESTREVIQDLIGHLFLMLHMIDTESEHDVEMSEGQGYKLNEAAERMVALDDPPASQKLQAAINDARRGHRPQEWERVVRGLATAAIEYMDWVNQSGPLAEAWEQGFNAARSGPGRDNPYSL